MVSASMTKSGWSDLNNMLDETSEQNMISMLGRSFEQRR